MNSWWIRYDDGNPKPRALRSKPTPDEEPSNDGTEPRMKTIEFKIKARGFKDKIRAKRFVDDTGVENDTVNLEIQLHMLDFDSFLSVFS